LRTLKIATNPKKGNKMTISNIDTLAISKAIAGKAVKAAQGNVGVGKHEVDVTVQVKGTVTVGKEYDQNIVTKLDTAALLAELLDSVNKETAIACIKASLSTDDDKRTKAKELTDAAWEDLKETTKTRCKGKLTSKLEVTAIASINADRVDVEVKKIA